MGNGDLVATPSALVQFFDDLYTVDNGGQPGPLTAGSLAAMLAEPTQPNSNQPPIDEPSDWYGLGWQVYNGNGPGHTLWYKEGDLPGTSSWLVLENNGATPASAWAWAASVNIDVEGDQAGSGTSGTSGFFAELRYLVNEALGTTTFNTPSQFVFLQQPGDVIAGQDMTPAVSVAVEDQHNNIVSSDNTSQMTLAILNRSNNIVGSVSATVTNGIATFSNVSVSAIGTAYTLSATDPTDSTNNVVSAPFNVLGPPAQLVFSRQPTNVAIGQIMSPGVDVKVEDTNGKVVTTDNSEVTVQLTSPPGNDTLIGNLTVPVVDGVAFFNSLAVQVAGTSYTLTASDPIDGIGATLSNSFNVSADHLVFARQPTNVAVGKKIAPAVTVEIVDAAGTVVTTDSSQVTVALATPAASTALAGTVTAAAVMGVATFSDLSISQAGDGYSLTASDPTDGLSGAIADSVTFNVIGPAAQLVFLQQPSNVGAGQTIKPPVTVEVVDANGNVVTSDSSQVTVQLTPTTPPTGATLGGTLKATASNGIATFSSLVVNQAGSYTLTANDSADQLSSIVSAMFNISTYHLVFLTQPSTVTAGQPMAKVQVEIVSSNGNVVTTDTNAVTVQFASEPGSGVLSGTLMVSAAKGIASFTNLLINQAGTGYTLSASDANDGVSAVISNAFNVTTADHLIFMQQPTSVETGQVLPAVTVEIVNSDGDVVKTDSSSQVTVQIAYQSGTGILSGTLTETAVKGVATFTTLSIDEPGIGYTLAATDPADLLANVLSKAFNVS